MRCLACDCVLNNKESTRRSASDNEFVDLCDVCLGTIPDMATYTNPRFEDRQDGDEDQEG